MRDALVRLLDEQKARLHACAECPVKGACVFVTPAYKPGYCLPEYKRVFALATRLLRHRATAGRSDSFRVDVAELAERVVREHPFGTGLATARARADRSTLPLQSSLLRFRGRD